MEISTPIIIYGAGGHGKVLAETLELLGEKNFHFWDQHPPSTPHNPPIFLPNTGPKGAIFLGIGNLNARKELLEKLGNTLDFYPFSLIHPSAFCSPSARLGKGTWLGPQSVVHTQANIGDHVMINSGAVVDHDVCIGNNVHVAPGAVLCGHVSVGDHTFIGANAVVPPGISIGSHAFIKAGTVVKEPVEDGGIA